MFHFSPVNFKWTEVVVVGRSLKGHVIACVHIVVSPVGPLF